MFKNRIVKVLVIGAALVAMAGAAVFGITSVVNAQVAGDDGDGWLWHGGRGEHLADDTYLAQALGISVEELQSARDAAYQAALAQAVAEGRLTQDEADRINQNGLGFQRMHGFGWGGNGMDELFAQELGISVETLHAAQDEAHQMAIEAALQSGDLTQEQADYLLAREAVWQYFDPQAAMAEALDMTVDELQTAQQSGPGWLASTGVSREDLQNAMQSAYQTAVQQAVDAGAITQTQADALLTNPAYPGMGGREFGSGRGGGRMHGNCQYEDVPAASIP